MTTFGSRIKDLARALGKEEQDVAADLGLSKSQLSHYTTGKRKVPSELLQRIVDIYKINPNYLFIEDAPLYIQKDIRKEDTYPYYPVGVAAGIPTSVECITHEDVETIFIPKMIMGKNANADGIYITTANGESMNNVISNGSLLVVKLVDINALKDGDIVIFSNEHEYSVKRFYNDTLNKRFIFRPDSSDARFVDYVVNYSDSNNLRIHGKVMMYIIDSN